MHAFNFRYSVNPISSVLLLTLLMLICNIAWGVEKGVEKDAESSAENVTVNPFENGWKLDSSSSSLVFQTISNDTNSEGLSDDDSKIESHTFDTIDATVDENGTASLRIQLDSVETKDDLRNVRLRFLSFETYKFAEAIVSAKIDPEALSTLSEKNKIEVPLEFELDFHGVKQTFQMQTIVMNLPDNQVSVESAAPVSIETALFDLDSGVKKLENSSNQTIVPMAAVSFNLVFNTSAESTSNNDAEDKLAEGQEGDKSEAEGKDAEGNEADDKEAEGEKAKDAEAEGKEAEDTEADGKEAEGEVTEDKEAEGKEAEANDKEAEDTASAEESAKTDAELPDVAVPVGVEVEIPTVALAIEPDSAPESTPYLSPYSEPNSEPNSAAGEAGDALSDEQCAERFESFSKTGGIYFESASARLDPKSVDVLSAIVEVANRCSQFKLTVSGHTDSTGSRTSNQRLSEQRALSVSEYLITNNVDRERLSAVGFGETKPLVPNNTPINRERNRRIEFSLAE